MASSNVRSFHHDVTVEKAGALETEEIVVQRLTEDDLLRMSKEAMPRFWTSTGWRLCLGYYSLVVGLKSN